LLQEKLTVENLQKELNDILTDPKKQQQIRSDYAELKQILYKNGNASANAAKIIVDFLAH
jgi:lipid-A-disaccharide synthase